MKSLTNKEVSGYFNHYLTMFMRIVINSDKKSVFLFCVKIRKVCILLRKDIKITIIYLIIFLLLFVAFSLLKKSDRSKLEV